MAATQQPTYRAYTIVKREGKEDFWLAIGAAFMHEDGDGFNVVLQALPIDGKIVLRLPKDDRTEPPAQEQTAQSNKSRPRRG